MSMFSNSTKWPMGMWFYITFCLAFIGAVALFGFGVATILLVLLP